jgi:hypothetical protein
LQHLQSLQTPVYSANFLFLHIRDFAIRNDAHLFEDIENIMQMEWNHKTVAGKFDRSVSAEKIITYDSAG